MWGTRKKKEKKEKGKRQKEREMIIPDRGQDPVALGLISGDSPDNNSEGYRDVNYKRRIETPGIHETLHTIPAAASGTAIPRGAPKRARSFPDKST